MPKKPKHGGKAPSMDKPDPTPPMDTEALAAEAGAAGMPPPRASGREDPMSAALMGGTPAGVPAAADPMSAALMGDAPADMPPEMSGAPPPPGMGGEEEQIMQIGQQFGPVVAAAMLVSPEVKQTLTEIIGQILMGQTGGPPPGMPPNGPPPGMSPSGPPPVMPPGMM